MEHQALQRVAAAQDKVSLRSQLRPFFRRPFQAWRKFLRWRPKRGRTSVRSRSRTAAAVRIAGQLGETSPETKLSSDGSRNQIRSSIEEV